MSTQPTARGPSMDSSSKQLEFDRLLAVCRKLSELPLDRLLDALLLEARKLVHAEAGTVYRVVPDHQLAFSCAHNDARPELCVPSEGGDCGAGSLTERTIPINNASLAGYAANNRTCLRIDDVHTLRGDADYHFDDAHDRASGYRTVSMLVIPLLDQTESPVGVLQLINRRDHKGSVTAFSARDEQIAMALASMAALSVRNAILLEEIRRKNDELKRAQLETVIRLATAAETRDDDTGQHIRRVSMYSETLARKLGCSDDYAFAVMCASPMHDIGKLGLADAILNKPGPLTDEERSIMQAHTTAGATILQDSPHEVMQVAERIARSHHERWDGRGYPQGLAGEAIPLEGRITAVADVFDALTSRRCYKPAFDVEKAYRIIVEESGGHFDPAVVEAFVAVRDEFRLIYDTFGGVPPDVDHRA